MIRLTPLEIGGHFKAPCLDLVLGIDDLFLGAAPIDCLPLKFPPEIL